MTKIGIDFNGVLAANWLLSITKNTGLNLFVPKTKIEKFGWNLIHLTSLFPAKGVGKLKEMVNTGNYEFFLISGMFDFMENWLEWFLNTWKLNGLFNSVYLNRENKLPHEFKAMKIRQLKLDYYIEDDVEIAKYLQGETSAKIITGGLKLGLVMVESEG
jgi:hypothetical protein